MVYTGGLDVLYRVVKLSKLASLMELEKELHPSNRQLGEKMFQIFQNGMVGF